MNNAMPPPVEGEPEAGSQARFMADGRVVLERATPPGKGIKTQMSLDDYAKLQELKRRVKCNQLKL